jgi:hypothetical protein
MRGRLLGGVAIVFAVALTFAQGNQARAAGGAFVVDDAAIDDPGACKVESSLSFAGNRDFFAMSTPACVVQLFKPVELGMIFLRTRQDGEWGSSVVPKAKMNILPVETGKFGLAISGGSSFDLLTGQYSGSFVNIPVTYQFSESFKINVNGGWIYERSNNQHLLAYGAGLEWIPAKPFTILAEVFGVAGAPGPTTSAREPRFQAGLRVTPIDTIDFDVIYGRNITGENANWITLGMNVRFPAPK